MGQILLQGESSRALDWSLILTDFQVHLIEKQEAKRQVLKKRAEQTKVDSDTEINWDDDEDDLDKEQDIPGKKSNALSYSDQ